jgi:hypothetical protein
VLVLRGENKFLPLQGAKVLFSLYSSSFFWCAQFNWLGAGEMSVSVVVIYEVIRLIHQLAFSIFLSPPPPAESVFQATSYYCFFSAISSSIFSLCHRTNPGSRQFF